MPLFALLSGRAAALVVVLAASLLLGLRHAGDPDHVAAITGLVAHEPSRRAAWRAGWLGWCWGLGHAGALVAVGLPLIWIEGQLPSALQRLVELAIAAVTIGLALRLLWRRGEAAERHAPLAPAPRSGGSALAIGLLHGLGGSGSLTLLTLAHLPGRSFAVLALLAFALGSALSMALLSAGLGWLLRALDWLRAWRVARPALGWALLLFGVWYGWHALA